MYQSERHGELRSRCFDGPLLERFSDVVEAHSDLIAVLAQDDAWTYSRLNEHANRIAAAAIKAEGTATAPIFLLFNNTPQAIASMLACLKLGRPYVPLSSSMPSERLAHIRDNAQGSLLLTETSNLERAASFTQGQIPVLDILSLDQDASPSLHLPVVLPNTPAWILYTSGSTGAPKGVVQTHRNLLHYVSIYTEKQALTSNDRLSLLFSYTANIASHDIFTALLNGATLCVYDVSISGLDPLANWIESMDITVFSCVPTLFRHFCREIHRHHDFQKLRFVKLVGEPVYQRDLESFQERFPATCINETSNHFKSDSQQHVCSLTGWEVPRPARFVGSARIRKLCSRGPMYPSAMLCATMRLHFLMNGHALYLKALSGRSWSVARTSHQATGAAPI